MIILIEIMDLHNFNYNPNDEQELEQKLNLPAGLVGRMPIVGASSKKQAFSSREGLVPQRSQERAQHYTSGRVQPQHMLRIPSRPPDVLTPLTRTPEAHIASPSSNHLKYFQVPDGDDGVLLRGSVNAAPPCQKYRLLPARGIFHA